MFLPESKTGKKTIILNAPALEVLNGLDRLGRYVVPGDDPDKPRADLKRPWAGSLVQLLARNRLISLGDARKLIGLLSTESPEAQRRVTAMRLST